MKKIIKANGFINDPKVQEKARQEIKQIFGAIHAKQRNSLWAKTKRFLYNSFIVVCNILAGMLFAGIIVASLGVIWSPDKTPFIQFAASCVVLFVALGVAVAVIEE